MYEEYDRQVKVIFKCLIGVIIMIFVLGAWTLTLHNATYIIEIENEYDIFRSQTINRENALYDYFKIAYENDKIVRRRR